MKLERSQTLNLPLEALIGGVVTSSNGIELGCIQHVRITISSDDTIDLLLCMEDNYSISWSDVEDYKIHFQAPFQCAPPF